MSMLPNFMYLVIMISFPKHNQKFGYHIAYSLLYTCTYLMKKIGKDLRLSLSSRMSFSSIGPGIVNSYGFLNGSEGTWAPIQNMSPLLTF